MKTLNNVPAIVQSVHEAALREINALEHSVATAEASADAGLWEQARQVVELLEAGLSQRQLAARWINTRTGKPYSQAHVSHVARTYRDKSTYQPRPRFRDAYNVVANPPPVDIFDAHVSAINAAFAESKENISQLGSSLREVRDKRLYRETHQTFDLYCRERFGFTAAWAEDVISLSSVEDADRFSEGMMDLFFRIKADAAPPNGR